MIVLDPCYDCYEPAIDLAGARAVHVPLDPQTFAPDWDEGARRDHAADAHADDQHAAQPVRRDARRAATWRRSPTLLRDTDIWLLSDEVYEHIVFDGARHESRAALSASCASARFVVSSFGKTYHCTGWKIGYCIAPPALIAEFRKVHQYNTFCSFAPAQYAFAAMIEPSPEHYERAGRVLPGQARPLPRAAADARS